MKLSQSQKQTQTTSVYTGEMLQECERLKNLITEDFKETFTPLFSGFIVYGTLTAVVCAMAITFVAYFHSWYALPITAILSFIAGCTGAVYTLITSPSRLGHVKVTNHMMQIRLLEFRAYELLMRTGSADEQSEAWPKLVTASDEIQKCIRQIGNYAEQSKKIKNLTRGEQALIAEARKMADQVKEETDATFKELDPTLDNHPTLAYEKTVSEAHILQTTDVLTERLIQE